MEKDTQMINELIKLKTENPDFEVCIMVDQDLCFSDFRWTEGKICSVEVGDRYEYGEVIHTDKEDLCITICDNFDLDDDEEEDKKKIAEELSKIPHKKVIFVNVSIP
jgi:hypothetical protein